MELKQNRKQKRKPKREKQNIDHYEKHMYINELSIRGPFNHYPGSTYTEILSCLYN